MAFDFSDLFEGRLPPIDLFMPPDLGDEEHDQAVDYAMRVLQMIGDTMPRYPLGALYVV